GDPDIPLAIHPDGAAGPVLLRVRAGDGRAPLAILVRAQSELYGVFRHPDRLEVLGLFLELRLLDAAGVVADRVTDVRDPQRAIGPVGGGGEIVLGVVHRDRGRSADEPDERGAVPEWDAVAGQDLRQRYLHLLPAPELHLELRVGLDVLELQDDADGRERFALVRDRVVLRRPHRAVRRCGPAVLPVEGVTGAEAITLAVDDLRPAHVRLA